MRWAASLLVLAAAGVLAAPPAPTLAQLRQAFALADVDGNGELTRLEAQRLPWLPRSFEELDTNKDGVLWRIEYEAALG